MKFLHIADVHLGAKPESGIGFGEVRREEIWDAFRRIIECCERESVDLLLISGDLFHAQPLLREVKEADYLFRSLRRTKVVMIAGNHDCLLPSSHYYDVTFPEHVTFLMDTQADSVYLPELNTEVFGASYEKAQITEARYDSICRTHPERINILLAHGNLLCNDKSIPIHRLALETAGFDYVALGHIHNRFEISSRIAYSGSLEPLNKGETGKKGYIVGTIKKEGVNPSEVYWKFVPGAKREYIPFTLEVTPQTTELSLCNELAAVIETKGLQHFYLVTLSGSRAKEQMFDSEELVRMVQSRGGIIVELQDKTVPDISLEKLRKEQQNTLLGRFMERMDTIEDEELRRLALHYGIQALLARDERMGEKL